MAQSLLLELFCKDIVFAFCPVDSLGFSEISWRVPQARPTAQNSLLFVPSSCCCSLFWLVYYHWLQTSCIFWPGHLDLILHIRTLGEFPFAFLLNCLWPHFLFVCLQLNCRMKHTHTHTTCIKVINKFIQQQGALKQSFISVSHAGQSQCRNICIRLVPIVNK